jgi:hypothetical protein
VDLANEAFGLVRTLVPRHVHGNATTTSSTTSLNKIGSTEIGYVRAATEDVISAKTPINVVKGALTGLQNVFKGKLTVYDQEQWLGSSREKSFWKYVYLTEFDTILQTKPSALPQLRAALEEGMILAPHRLQILPHEHDLLGISTKNRKRVVPAVGNFTVVQELNPLKGAVCCDELSNEKPWKAHPNCGSFWWQCGFNEQQDHSRLEQYDLIRLKPGMNLVTLAANHNGRRCKPSTNGVCSRSPDT